jgi:hypothetical protein
VDTSKINIGYINKGMVKMYLLPKVNFDLQNLTIGDTKNENIAKM